MLPQATKEIAIYIGDKINEFRENEKIQEITKEVVVPTASVAGGVSLVTLFITQLTIFDFPFIFIRG